VHAQKLAGGHGGNQRFGLSVVGMLVDSISDTANHYSDDGLKGLARQRIYPSSSLNNKNSRFQTSLRRCRVFFWHKDVVDPLIAMKRLEAGSVRENKAECV
jgi:hypothetical protein